MSNNFLKLPKVIDTKNDQYILCLEADEFGYRIGYRSTTFKNVYYIDTYNEDFETAVEELKCQLKDLEYIETDEND